MGDGIIVGAAALYWQFHYQFWALRCSSAQIF